MKNFRQNYFEKLYANIYVTVHVFVDNIGNSLSVIVRSRIINPRRKRTVCLFFFFFQIKLSRNFSLRLMRHETFETMSFGNK